MNLTEMVTRVREDLQDTDSQNYRWTDAEIQSAILRAVDEYSIRAPIEQQDDIATTDGDTELDISGLTGLLKVESVEFPLEDTPRHFQHFDYWAGALHMEHEGDGTNARVSWLKKHTLTTESTTIPAEHEEVIVLGATSHLAMSASVSTVDKATIGGSSTIQQFRLWARQRRYEYEDRLQAISRGARLIPKRLVSDEDEYD